jgi:CRISPR-associated protein Cmr3
MRAFELHPVDTLFFRDARPMEAGAGSGGHGANWPLPPVVHAALRTALLRQVGDIHPRRSVQGHRRFRDGKLVNDPWIFTTAFRSLHTRGPLPVRDGRLFMPRPLDLVPVGVKGAGLLNPVTAPTGASNLPVQWLHPITVPGRADKRLLPEWVPLDAFITALAGRVPVLTDHDPLSDCEHRLGIELNDNTGAAVEGRLYTAEHLRLREGVRLWVETALTDRAPLENKATLDSILNIVFPLGGESRMVRCESSAVLPPAVDKPSGRFVKWVLSSHAVFSGGWRPNWVDETTGQVLLKQGEVDRFPQESRQDWRKRVRQLPQVKARLVAACVAKPIHFSGWDTGWTPPGDVQAAPGGAKPTLLAAPAGSVYYFLTETDEDGQMLVDALHGRTRSDFLGEKGLGWGFCGTWNPVDVSGRPVSGGWLQNQR